ncbi:molybdopterin oxidoreductase family protein [Saccharothrix australiensis]|uniref:Assimilatory nitrate reductase catalytic subunit n=1 Tax=Saccharothrix australiensis TaxID=2072 RepID=A0A495VZ38_9PSEU|nr:molybdopterin oxidoreductase family protein [Saccharothrix australiensis]RKT54130.1 assimilatory nitrate reductase catalytic subunit [Saccharothrix australiensis]
MNTSNIALLATDTHCPYCALQCGMTVDAAGGNVRVRPRWFPTNQGGLCQKGWTSTAVLTAPDRLTTPLLRTAGDGLRPAGWDDALDQVARRLAAVRDRHGPGSVGVLGGGGLTNEKVYLLGKLARVALRTPHVDYNGRFCMSSAAAATIRAFGVDRGLPFPLTDLAGADAVLLVGANVAETMPPFVQHLGRAIDAGGLVVVDPRRTATARHAGLHLRTQPGTDLALALGMLHIAVTDGHVAETYVRERTSGFDRAWRVAARWWPERTERVTGVAVADQRLAVRLLAQADNAYVLTARGTEQHANGTAMVSAWVNLALALGLPGVAGSGYGTITGQGNGQGGREHGQKADQLPGYRKIDDPDARRHVAAVWGVPEAELPSRGRSAYEILDAAGRPGGIRALLVFGTNPVVSAPDAARVTERLRALDLLVVADFVRSETAELADAVLPVTQWAEEDGTLTNLEGRVLLRRRTVDPPDGVRGDLDVISGIAVRLGQPPERFPTGVEEVFAELGRASAGGPADYSGMSHGRLRAGEGLYWPCPAPDHPGTPRLFLDGFPLPGGRARFAPVDHAAPAETTSERFPLWATTGRLLQHYQTGTQTRRVAELDEAAPEVYVEVHPDTAARAGLADGGRATVSSARGSTSARVRYEPTMRVDTVFLPFHFPDGQRANLVTNPALDPTSRIPELKVCAVRLDPHPLPEEGTRR